MITEQLREGTLLNERYRILQILGQGGMGTVYLAEHTRLGTQVAVKEVRGVLSNTAELREALTRCEQEGRLLVRLHHPNLPQVTDAFVENDRFYMVMEYIEGVTLDAMLREQNGEPLDVVSVVNWAVQVARVLQYLHAQQPSIIFRDLKPANIMVLADGTVRLIDFGIARRFQKDAPADTDPLGSVGYSPPEQFGDRQTDTRSDIYAFGATLHHLLTGRHPSSRPFRFIPVRNTNPHVPASLSALINRCVAEDPDSRPASMDEVARALEAVRAELPTSLREVQTGTLSSSRLYQALSSGTTRLFGSGRQSVGPLLVTLLGVCALVYFAYSGLSRPQEPTTLVVQPPLPPSGGSANPPPVTNAPPTPSPPVGFVALRRGEGLSEEMKYWFENDSAPKFLPQPLTNFDEKGVAALGVPADYMKEDTLLVVQNSDEYRLKIPLVELYERYKKAADLVANPPNLLKNGDFRSEGFLWKMETRRAPAKLTFRSLDPPVAAKGVDGKTAVVTLDIAEDPEAEAHLVHTSLALVEDGSYRLRFWAKADTKRSIGLLTRLNTLGGGSSGLASKASLSVRWQPFELPFNVTVPPSQREPRTIKFRFTPPGTAQQVHLGGTFNGWNFKADPMTRMADGKTWETSVSLEPGNYEYKFVVDGGKDWFTDPNAPELDDGKGHVNSTIKVFAKPERHRLSFMLGHGAGRIQIAGVTVQPEGDTIKKPAPEDIKITVELKADDFERVSETKTP